MEPGKTRLHKIENGGKVLKEDDVSMASMDRSRRVRRGQSSLSI